MDASTARSRIIQALLAFREFDPAALLCIDDALVDYSSVLAPRVPRAHIFGISDDVRLDAVVNSGSPWVHAQLHFTSDRVPIAILATQSARNGRQAPGTYSEPAINSAYADRAVAELVDGH